MKILLADDHALFREGIKLVLKRLGPDITIVDASDYHELMDLATVNADADLVLVDLDMPGAEPFSALKGLLTRVPTLPVIVLTASESPEHMRKVMDIGVMGFIPKRETSDVMLSAIKLVLAGGVYIPKLMMKLNQSNQREIDVDALTPRQLDVLRCLVIGKSNKQIGQELGLTEATVKVHVSAIFRALAVNNRTQAARAAEDLGLLKLC